MQCKKLKICLQKLYWAHKIGSQNYFTLGYHLICFLGAFFFPKSLFNIQSAPLVENYSSISITYTLWKPSAHEGLALTTFSQSREREKELISESKGTVSCCHWWYKPDDRNSCIESHYIKVTERVVKQLLSWKNSHHKWHFQHSLNT